ncbi:MAG: PASTA domain-containing protein [Candidatus Kapabacteria bacterium]|nr:PASTA domain-containing protein [Ignavibacteriota bacterium]MCW5886071.1 PASTA domain-containing protein [Candidatus Kapabacteria bacterium]
MDNDNNTNIDLEEIRKKKFWKFWLVMLLLNIGLFAVIYRMINVQIIHADKYKQMAKRQHESKINLSAQRGKIFDRYGRLIASNLESVSIAVDPNLLKNKGKLADILFEDVNIPREKTINKINSAKGSFVWLARGLFPEKLKRVEEMNEKGVILIKEPRRIYHYGLVCSQVVGFTDIDNNGLSGVELLHDSLLKGTNGYMLMYRDGRQRLRPAADLPVYLPIDGYSLQLTIDIEFQRIVEYELMKGVQKADAEAGTVIAIEPSTGEILAMATYPTYDPHNPQSNNIGSMRMRAITDTYEPGSTFKIITAAAALEENLVHEEDKFNGYGGAMQFRSFVIRDVHGVGTVTFQEAMQHSSNIIMSNVANMIPDNTFYKYIRDFGYGIKSGIDFPGEAPGKLAKPEEYNAASKRYMGFGYGLSATPLQITNSYATIANKGQMMKPYLIKSINDLSGNSVYKANPEIIRRVISENTALRLNEMLKGVVNKGTGKGVRVDNLQVCGKTGTAQQIENGSYSKSNYTASFAGFFPAENPKVAMIVILDKPRSSIYGGAVSGPIFKNIALRWASVSDEIKSGNLLEFAKIDTLEVELPDEFTVPNLVGKSKEEALKIATLTGFKLTMNDTKGNKIASQNPQYGSKLTKEQAIDVLFDAEIVASDSAKAKPDLIGLPLRYALSLLNSQSVKSKVFGSGTVRKQIWENIGKENEICILHCN